MRLGKATSSIAKSSKLVFLCVALLGAFLLVDLLWASSSSSSSSFNWALPASNLRFFPNQTANKKGDARILSATFADLPAPQLKWEKMATSPVPRLDGAAIQINDLLYVFAGYGTIDHVHSHVDIYNFTANSWGGTFDMPKEMAHSHLGMVTDGRYIYIVTGQYGPQCRGPTARNFVLDTKTKQWQDLPSLPVPRYAPATQLWRGRLHVMGGSKENRHTPGLEHWSIAVKDGKALETEWRTEIPIPRGGPHRACVVYDDRLYVLGGQEGDFMAKPGSPIFKCSRRNEVVYDDVYMLDDDMTWKVLPPMPKPDSHIEFAWAIVNRSLVIVGGTTEKHPNTKKMTLVGEIFQFQFDTQVVTCGNVPLESSFQKVPRCVYTSTSLYEYRGWDSKAANPTQRRFTWGLRSSERHVVDFYISDFQSGLRALVKTGCGAKVTPYVDESVVVDVDALNSELSPEFIRWLRERNLSSDDRVMRLKEGYIKEGSTVSVIGVVQRNENVLMIVPPPEPFTTGCQWLKCIFPASLEGIVLRCEDASKIDAIPV